MIEDRSALSVPSRTEQVITIEEFGKGVVNRRVFAFI